MKTRLLITNVNRFWFTQKSFREYDLIFTDITERIKHGQKVVFPGTAVRDRLGGTIIDDFDKSQIFTQIKIDKALSSIVGGCLW